jgi:hypothetical protein
MKPTIVQNQVLTTSVVTGHYAKATMLPEMPPSPSLPPQPPEPPIDAYVRIHRAPDKKVIIRYNVDEADARAVRRQISKLLNE